MAAAPFWKVYDAEGTYQASCKEPEAAAALVSFYGDGATIRGGHSSVPAWKEGAEDQPASESYDFVNEVCRARLKTRQKAFEAKWNVRVEEPKP